MDELPLPVTGTDATEEETENHIMGSDGVRWTAS